MKKPPGKFIHTLIADTIQGNRGCKKELLALLTYKQELVYLSTDTSWPREVKRR